MLPIGISFYVFSGLSYLIDIYWRRYHAEKNLLDFALYIALFSKLTAGPIVRAEEFLPQVKSYRGLRLDKFSEGIQIFVFGLFKKIVLADHLCVFVDDVFSAPAAFDTFTTILAVISYSFQIYFDFSGYSDMAIGISKAIGFDFPPNFNLPYLAGNSSEFWKRWHISLSSWFQEYLYIPLGGSRKGEARTYFNLLTVMLVSGFWHGAGWTFIFWGFLHGITNCVFRFFSKKYKIKFECMPLNFLVATIFWVAFRADCIDTAFAVWKGMFTLHSGITQIYSWTFFAGFCLLFSSVAAIISSKKKCLKMVNGFYPIMDLSKLSSLILFFTFIGLTVIMGYFGNNAFIYGKF
ncbi:MAG: MBOAT family protein [Dorea sp.]|nr:MBOAT family protein [Dorea sp.]